MKIAMLSPVAWRTPPRHYGPWEQVVSLLTEGLVRRGMDVTLFASSDSITEGRLESVCRGWEEDPELDPKVWECVHIANLMERANRFDLIHNNFDFLPLSYSRLVRTPMVTTIHGFSSPRILPVYRRYNDTVSYISISLADRAPGLDYIANIYHGIETEKFPFSAKPGDYLLFFGRIHPDKGVREAIETARRFGMRIMLAGVIQDRGYFLREIEPHIDGDKVAYLGSVGPEGRGPLLAGAYALLHLINFREPFGLSLVESMACGTPVVARPLGSIPEIVAHGLTGFHAGTIEEAIQSLKMVPAIDRRKCRSWVNNRFHRDRMVSDYIDVYREISGPGKRKGISRGGISNRS